MIYTLDQLREKIAPIAEKYQIPAVYVFGSYARGEATEDSDVDLLIDRTGSKIRGLFDMGGLYNDINETLGKNLSLETMQNLSDNSLRRDFPRYVHNLNRERIIIHERQRSAAA